MTVITGVLTNHGPLLLDKSANIPENLVELVYTRLDLTDFFLPFLNQRLLVREFLRRELSLKSLHLSLGWRWACRPLIPTNRQLPSQDGGDADVRSSMLIFYGVFDSFHHISLALRTHLLCALERNK